MTRRNAALAGLAALLVLAGVVCWHWQNLKWYFYKRQPAALAATAAIRFPGVRQVTEIEEHGTVHVEVITRDNVTDPAVFEQTLCTRITAAGGAGVMIRVLREADRGSVWTGVCR